ncbi:YqhA family protein [Mariprofundus erugo]|uniref:YqhA family protein n=1 Tax=Mariprofundus erugo TaxID=2528639 RepID=A0A5R9GR06_9PROT|nr:YqhA family protein [Mariprofundus erugo]TLS67505.1 YqhA family protein [Mariprofundus erugo]
MPDDRNLEGIKPRSEQSHIEIVFEDGLWFGRWMVLIAVMGGMLTATGMFIIGSVDVFHVAEMVLEYPAIQEHEARGIMRANLVGHIVEVIDGFLLAIVLLIFSYGIYELYVSRIDRAYSKGSAFKHMLSISSLDDLKARLGKVILMILVVKFFEMAISIEFHTIDDLLKFSLGVILIGTVIFAAQLVDHKVHGK